MPGSDAAFTQLKDALLLNLQKLEGLNQKLDQFVQTAKQFSDTAFAVGVKRISHWDDFNKNIDEALKALKEAFRGLQSLNVHNLRLEDKLAHSTHMELGKTMREIDRQREYLVALFKAAQDYIANKPRKSEGEKVKRVKALDAAIDQTHRLLNDAGNQKNYEYAVKLLKAHPVLLAQRLADAKARLGGGGHVRSQSTPPPETRIADQFIPTPGAGYATIGRFGRNTYSAGEVAGTPSAPREDSEVMARRLADTYRASQTFFGDGEKQSLLGKKPKSSCCCGDTSAADTPPLPRRSYYGAI
ncbi:MAG: hypothetical protein K0S08_1447 [Gammaproteobacteria bacterium]|jgi:hypothetical protein|nr:hypothetical protein [Gammaproteobacteria bacterium]